MRLWSILLIKSDLKWCIHLSRSPYLYFNYLVSVTAGGPVTSVPRAHVAKFYGRLRLIRSFESIKIFRVKIDWNCNFVGLLHHPFWLQLVLVLLGIIFNFWNYSVWLRITDEGSVPEMRIWSILLIKSDLKWCTHLSRSLYLYFYWILQSKNTPPPQKKKK